MKKQTFEKFLEDQFENSSSADGVLDDDLSDKLSDWMSELDVQEVMDYAQDWGDKMYEEGEVACLIAKNNAELDQDEYKKENIN